MIKRDILNHYSIDYDFFDFSHNYLFNNKDSKKYMKGGREYIRPCVV